MEHDEQAERLEREAQDMEQRSEKVGDRIEETKRDWGAKEDDPSVPGARPDPDAADAENEVDEEESS